MSGNVPLGHRLPLALPSRLRAGVMAGAVVLMLGALLPAHPVWAASAAIPATGGAQAAPAAWWQQFDDPVLTELLAPLGAREPERAQALARQWVAVRVYHLQGAVVDALARMSRAEQAALMDLPVDSPERDARLARVAEQLAQAQRYTADRASRRDQAIEAVARLSGQPVAQLVARITTPLAEGRLPHLVAEPPTLRVTLSAHTSEQAQRLTALHACHEAARQADRAVLAARQALAQAQSPSPSPSQSQASPAAAGTGAGEAAGGTAPVDAATARATQALLMAASHQAATAGDLALAWLDYLAVAPSPAAAGGGHTATRGGAKPA